MILLAQFLVNNTSQSLRKIYLLSVFHFINNLRLRMFLLLKCYYTFFTAHDPVTAAAGSAVPLSTAYDIRSDYRTATSGASAYETARQSNVPDLSTRRSLQRAPRLSQGGDPTSAEYNTAQIG